MILKQELLYLNIDKNHPFNIGNM